MPTSAFAQPSGQPLERAETAPQDTRHEVRQDPSPRPGPGWLHGAAPRIAVYRDAQAPPVVEPLVEAVWSGDPIGGHSDGLPLVAGPGPAKRAARADGTETSGFSGSSDPSGSFGSSDPSGAAHSPDPGAARAPVPQLIELLTKRSYDLAREQGGVIPAIVFRELIENLVHAGFSGVVITILDRGNTLRVSDQGPGIPDKEAALRPGFTSAASSAKRFIRGVGSGFAVARETLTGLGGTLTIEDNVGRGTVITARVPPPVETLLAPTPAPEYNLSERQLKVLLLTVELAPGGPTRIAQELGVSTSTAYRDLVSLEEAGFVVCRPSGHRSATDAGLTYLNAVL